jgi:hypothetical protein
MNKSVGASRSIKEAADVGQWALWQNILRMIVITQALLPGHVKSIVGTTPFLLNIRHCLLARGRISALTSSLCIAFAYYCESSFYLMISAYFETLKSQNTCSSPPYLLNYCQYIVQI